MLRIGTTGTETAFLAESELPDCARLSSTSEEDVLAQSRKQAEDRDLQEALKRSKENSSELFNLTFCILYSYWIPRRRQKK